MIKKSWFLFLLFSTSILFGQNISMSNGSSSQCSGNFYDSGGSGAQYGNNQTFTYTICPSTAGQSVSVNFTSFNTESGLDLLYVYSGNSTSSQLLGIYSGTTSPGTLTSYASNGCLTFYFQSDGSVTKAGWAATISCVAPPSTPLSNLLISNTTTSACSGTFYDTGGSGSNYTNNQDITYTICPSTPGAKVKLVFSSFSLENNYDFMYVYDGNSTAAPSLGTYTGTTSPGTVQATSSNSSGCITIRFTSDGSTTSTGWAAAISCIVPCQTITSNFVTSNPAPNASGVIQICQGQSVTFNGSGTFSNSGTGASYVWSFGNGSTANGSTVSNTFTTAGAYTVNLNITDPNGCTNSNLINKVVQVSTTPTITTSVAPNPICVGQSANLSANVTMTPYVQNCTPPVSGTTFLPDGSGVSYQTPITVNCFANTQTVQSASDIQNICVTMEHSYMGDLQIELICPNGQTVILKSYANGGGGTYLGCPIDNTTGGPGSGRTYCFTPTATTLLTAGATSSCGSPAGASVNAGNYMPTQALSGFIGCPLNGQWIIKVTDNLAADDGYIFNWDVNFNSALQPAATSFTPTIVSQGWVNTSGLTPTGATTATVTPTTAGSNCYTYSLTDNFGCSYSNVQCLTVNPCSSCTAINTGAYCPGQTIQLNATGGGTYSWTGPNGFSSSLQNPTIVNATTAMAGTYTVTVTASTGATCTATTTVVVNPSPTLTCPPALVISACNASVPAGATTPAAFTSLGGSTNATSISYSDGSPVTTGCSEVTTRTYTASLNSCVTTCTQTITRTVDNQAPTVTGSLPASTVSGCTTTGAPAAVTTVAALESLGVAISDNCTLDANLVVTSSDATSGTCPITITRTYTIKDACNNQTTLTQTITVGDAIAPTVTGTLTASNITGCSTTGAPAAETTVAGLEALGVAISDNCTLDANLVVTSSDATSGTCLITITRTYTIKDACNNQTTLTQTITVGDAIAPTFTNFPVNVSVGCDAVPLVPSISGSDNCSSATIVYNGETGTPSICGYTIIRSWTATDACGNSTTNAQTITVQPTQTPTVTLPSGLPTTLSYNNAILYTSAPDALYSNGMTGNCLISGTLSAVLTQNYDACAGGTIVINYSGIDTCGNPISAQHTINVTPIQPTVSIISTLSSITNGQQTQLTATGNPTGGTYSWSPAASLNVSTGAVVLANPTTTTTYTVNYTINGCIATSTTTITVNQLSVTVNSSTICAGQSATLTATPSTTGGTYIWSPGGQTTQSITVTPSSNSFYSVVYTLNGVSTNSVIGTVSVNPTPIVTVNNPTICAGQSGSITATASPTGGAYLWTPGGQSSANITVSPASTTTYNVTYTLNNCPSSATSTVTVNPQPTVTIANQTICSGQSVSLTANVNPSGGTYLWSPGGQTTSIISVSPTTTSSYSVTYTLNNCSATATGSVTVNPIPTVSVTTDTICIGEAGSLTATGTPLGGTYLWVSGGETTPSISASPTSTTSYSVTYTLNGCTSNAGTGTIIVNAIPTVTVINDTICNGQTGQLAAVATPSGGTFTWAPGGQSGSLFTDNPSVTTNYNVIYTLNGCSSTPAQAMIVIAPTPVVSFTADNLSGCAPLNVNFTNTSGTSGSTEIWNLGNGIIEYGPNASFTYSQTGCYDITLSITENGCIGTATLQDYICVEEIPTASFAISPNTFTEETQSISFVNNSVGAIGYSWNFSDGFTSYNENPNHIFHNTTMGYLVTLTVSSSLGCTDETQVFISYTEGELFYIPNTFTPDGDGFNQTFKPIFTSGFDPFNFVMLIYNRWGELIFETHDANRGWDGSYGMDGRDVQQGTYTYKITYKNPKLDERKTVVGHVSLIK